MKKNVSWSAETLKRDREIAKAMEQESNGKISKSQSAEASKKITSPAVNSRIQQMIAMQKAQNATMKQLMSVGDASSASPSGLRDLVTKSDLKNAGIDLKAVPEEVKGVVEKEVQQLRQFQLQKNEEVKIKMEPIKPPSIQRGAAYTESELTSRPDGGIHHQGSSKTNNGIESQLLPGAPPQNPYKSSSHHNPSVTYSTPDHLNPKLPRFSSDSSSCDSPISYNSVLDQNSTPATVRERKRQQLQTIQSQEQMMAEHHTDEFKIEPMPLSLQNPVKEFNWESIVTGNEDYIPPMPNLSSQQGYGATCVGNNGADYNPSRAITGEHILAQETKQHDSIGTERQGLLSHNSPAEISQRQSTTSVESHTQHMFHYGGRNGVGGPPTSVNVHSEYDYHSAYHGDDHGLFHIPHEHKHRRRRRRHIMLKIVCYPFQCLRNEQLGRSFCFGAIDGMLTGAGILAGCIGLGLLPHRSRLMDSPLSTEETMHTEWILIALTLAACFSDGICMAVGHVWSTRLVAGSTYEERKEELRNFETSRSDSKARLVDSLLSKGMLKIDAMSLADTLEGYPDMFVSALLGEGFCGQGNSTVCGMSGLGSGGGGSGMVRVPSGGASIPSQRKVISQHNPMNNAWDIPPPSYGPGELHHGLKYESYSDFSDYQQDPDLKLYTETMSDSRLEGFLMMMSFGSFSVVPILIYSFLPYLVDYVTSTRDVNNMLMHDHPPKNTTVMMLALGFTTTIMFLLGAWKSHFYSSHWCMFGFETIGVLLLCIASAYLVGLGCGFLINAHFS